MNTWTNPVLKTTIFRCPDEQWADACANNATGPLPMPWNHLLFNDPPAYGYIMDNDQRGPCAVDLDKHRAYEANARAILPSFAQENTIRTAGRWLMHGRSIVPLIVCAIMGENKNAEPLIHL